MNWKNRLTNYNFWVSIVSAVLLILQALKIKVDFIYVNEVSTAILGLLVVIGIINDPTKSNKTSVKTASDETKNSLEEKAETDENNKKFSENEENDAKISQNDEILAENLEDSKIFEETNQDIEKVENKNSVSNKNADLMEDVKKAQTQIPTNNENEVSDVGVQTDLQVDEVEPKTQVFKIVN